jgi:hypothetical protein
MYQHCPSCTRDLGRNEALEHFPVGGRLAFDGAKGRLWVLCPRCRSWNLAPIEERWEAVEEAERSFERAAQGLATEHIAIGRLADGTELVRIGQAKPPELAGWRYADRIGRRWKRTQQVGAVSTAGWVMLGPMGIASTAIPVILVGAGAWGVWNHLKKRDRRIEFDMERENGGDPYRKRVSRGELRTLHLVTDGNATGDDGGWGLELRALGRPTVMIPEELRNRALRLSLLELNQQIGKPAHVRKALDNVVSAGDPDRLALRAARTLAGGRAWETHLGWPFGPGTAISRADPVLRLALEIAANEEAERIALEGELHRLELEWREAEELAAISDGLLVPAWVRQRIAEWRKDAKG